MLRKCLVLALVVGLIACGEARDDSPPPLDEATGADLSARAIAIACEQVCVGNEVPIRDLVYEQAVTPLEGVPLSDAQRQAFTQQFLEVRFLDDSEAVEFVDGGGVALVMGPVTQAEDGTIEVEVAAERSDELEVITQGYQWSGDEWVPIVE